MRLSEINLKNLQDEDIQSNVYSDITDSGKATKYSLVFGNSMLIKERVTTAWKAYRGRRKKKVILTGGKAGISNQEHNLLPEAIKMKKLTIELRVQKKIF